MKDVIRGLNANSKRVEVDTSFGAIYFEGNKQLENFCENGLYCIPFEIIPLKATRSYGDFIDWIISKYY